MFISVVHSKYQPDLCVQKTLLAMNLCSSTCVSWFCLMVGASFGYFAGDSFTSRCFG